MNMTGKGIAASALFLGLSTIASAQDAETLTVRTDWLPWGIHAGLHLAAEKGWFEEAGLDVQVSDGKGSSLTMQQVAAGEIDIGQIQLSAMAVAKGQGLPVISIAGLARKGDLGAIVPVDGGISKVSDLEGKKVAYTASSGWGPLVESFFKAGEADRSKIELINVDASSLMSTYISGTVDAVLTTYPFAKPTADKGRESTGVLLADVGINLPSYGLIVQESTVEEKRDALAKFVPVVTRAWKYIYDGHIDEAVAAVESQRPNEKLDLDIIRGQIVAFEPFFVTESTEGKPYGWQAEEDWQNAVEVLKEVGSLPDSARASDFYTNEFVR